MKNQKDKKSTNKDKVSQSSKKGQKKGSKTCEQVKSHKKGNTKVSSYPRKKK